MSSKLYSGRKGSKASSSLQKRSKISNRRPPNRHSFEDCSEYVSASSKKLKLSNLNNERDVNSNFGYRLINFFTVFTALSDAVSCKQCHGEVRFSEGSRRGLGSKIIVSCSNCGDVSINSCPIINDRAYEINTRITLAMRMLGIGINGIKKFCAFMDLPKPVFQTTYYNIISNILIATARVRELCIKKAAAEEKQKSMEHNEVDGLTVSSDGSWRKRGFSSLFGLVTLIGWYTGKVLDVCVKSKYCKVCEYWKNKEGTAEYEEVYAAHEPKCYANHQGSAGKMEDDAVVEIFRRSEKWHNIKYINYIGDGDSKTHTKVLLTQSPMEIVRL